MALFTGSLTQYFIDQLQCKYQFVAKTNVGKKLEKLLTQYETSGETLNDFLGGVKKLKKYAVLKNIGACIGALGVLAPALMLITRKDNEYQVKADIEKKLAQKQNQPDIDKKS